MIRPNGFTLIELLVALVAGSFLLVSLSWTLSTLTEQMVGSSERRSGRLTAEALPKVLAMVERMQPSGREAERFEGRRDGFTAIVPPPQAAGAVGLLRLRVDVRPTPRGQALFARFEPLGPSPAVPVSALEERALLDGYRDISIGYVSTAETNPPRRLPALITIEASDTTGRLRRFSAAPKIDSDGACRFDPISMSCRY